MTLRTIYNTVLVDWQKLDNAPQDTNTELDIRWNYYKYVIVPTVDVSWNLTVSLKNYLWNTPTSQYPVKSQVWDTIRTITSALSTVVNAWTSYLNLWSSELATKEVDLFCYLQWNTTTSALNLLVSRIPFATTMSDFANSSTNEKWAIWIINYNATDKVQNIWRLSAILSAWAGYTWSLWTWPIINHYINETRWLNYNALHSASWSMTWTSVTATNQYKITWKTIQFIINSKWTTGGTQDLILYITSPWTTSINYSWTIIWWKQWNNINSWYDWQWSNFLIWYVVAWVQNWGLWANTWIYSNWTFTFPFNP